MSATITNSNTAKAILTAAKENDVWEEPIPTDEKKLLEDANFVYEQADAAWNNNIRGKAVTAVKFAAEVTGASEGRDIETDELGATSEEEREDRIEGILMQSIAMVKKELEDSLDDADFLADVLAAEKKWKKRGTLVNWLDIQLADAYKEPDENTGELESGDRGANHGSGSVSPWDTASSPTAHPEIPDEPPGGFAKTKLDETFEAEEFGRAQARKLNLPLPEQVDDIPSATLSRGVANLTIEQLAERLTDASLCLAAATWQTAMAEIDQEHATRVGDHYWNKAYAKAAPNAKNVQAASAIADEEDQVREWRSKEAEAENRYKTFRALKEIYKGTYDTVSRVFAMKQLEYESRV